MNDLDSRSVGGDLEEYTDWVDEHFNVYTQVTRGFSREFIDGLESYLETRNGERAEEAVRDYTEVVAGRASDVTDWSRAGISYNAVKKALEEASSIVEEDTGRMEWFSRKVTGVDHELHLRELWKRSYTEL